jgi:hypothetical protein
MLRLAQALMPHIALHLLHVQERFQRCALRCQDAANVGATITPACTCLLEHWPVARTQQAMLVTFSVTAMYGRNRPRCQPPQDPSLACHVYANVMLWWAHILLHAGGGRHEPNCI